eukprot:scaffold22773_cov35-Cyclotella_meneghiniana.AAC.2
MEERWWVSETSRLMERFSCWWALGVRWGDSRDRLLLSVSAWPVRDMTEPSSSSSPRGWNGLDMSDMFSSACEVWSSTRMVSGARNSSSSGEVAAHPGVWDPRWWVCTGVGAGVATGWGVGVGRRGPLYR